MRWLQTIAPLALAGLVGCGADDGVPRVPVSGTITMNGKPMAGATVAFIPDPGNKHQTPGSDATGPEGNYLLQWNHRSGVAPGSYKVAVTPALVLPAGAKIPDAFKDDPYMAQMSIGDGSAEKKKAVTGTKYEFSAEVTDQDKGKPFDFDVKATAEKK
jgi:hypothetical protein